MVIEGKLHKKFDTQHVSEKFAKRDFVVEIQDNPLYPQFVIFQCTQDRCKLLDPFGEGEKLEVTFNLRGREWTDKNTAEVKSFNTLEAWRIQGVAGGSTSTQDLADRGPKLPGEDDDDPFGSDNPPF